MKSAYDTSHRSWFSCSSCFCFLANLLLRRGSGVRALGRRVVAGVRRQLLLEDARVEAGLDRKHAFGDQRLALFLDVQLALDLVGHRKKDQVGDGDAIHGRDERRRDTATELGWIRQV